MMNASFIGILLPIRLITILELKHGVIVLWPVEATVTGILAAFSGAVVTNGAAVITAAVAVVATAVVVVMLDVAVVVDVVPVTTTEAAAVEVA